ncbi:MAG: YqgE/AlgH family protein [Rhodospirillaceae bacterium]|nr:YqgE/AlgH family protein [Rhodospirillaceae bacterium]MCY4310786.1 YqgE/AlgH family protein [Rhodospirillaceae bacterium]
MQWRPTITGSDTSANQAASSVWLTGKLLIAMPRMSDSRFAHTVIYICAHSEDGAMGLIVNKLSDSITFKELLEQVGVDNYDLQRDLPIHVGGPVEKARGFVLHGDDYEHDGTMEVENGIGLTASVDILRDVALGSGPRNCLLALGYSGWGAGQLEQEIQQNGWLTAEADEALIFGAGTDEDRWRTAIQKLGIDPSMLSSTAGQA